jgi:hypothetical protein
MLELARVKHYSLFFPQRHDQKSVKITLRPEVLRLRPELRHYVVVKLGHGRQELGKFGILKGLLLILCCQLLANLVSILFF